MWIRSPLTAIVVLVFSVAGAAAAPTGLFVIPTADVLGPGEVCVDGFTQGRNLARDEDCDRFLGVEVGLARGVEIGVDTCVNHGGDDGPWWNLKWQLPWGDTDRQAVAIGLQNVGHGTSAQPYVTLAQALGRGRGHLGIMRADSATRLYLGAEAPLTETLVLAGDYLSGPGGSTSAGLVWSLGPAWSLMVGRIWNRGEDSEHHWYVDVGYAFTAF